MNWETLKEQAKVWYARLSQVLVFLGLCFYLFASVVAARPVTPRAYVSFAYHCFQWRPGDAWLAREGIYSAGRR